MESDYPEGLGIPTRISNQDNPKGVSTGRPDLDNPPSSVSSKASLGYVNLTITTKKYTNYKVIS